MNRSAHFYALGTAVVLIAVVTACGTSSTGASTTTTRTSTAVTSGGGLPMPAAPVGPHNQADITFASLMIVHHQSAIQMADLAPTRAADAAVKELAARIKAAQAPEISQMASWLATWAPGTDMNGMPNPTPTPPSSGGSAGMTGMSHGGGPSTAAMPGMMTGAQLTQLTAATGPAFDKLFLHLMIGHHQGAREMAITEKGFGQNPAALALADSIITSQTAEITTMQKLLQAE